MEKRLRLKEEVISKVNNSIFITGSARSGTTIMGKIIHSMKNIEYAFEPPTLLSLFAEINDNHISNEAWSLLFETYLYEDFLVNAIAGRNLNFKPNEDSYINLVKTTREIENRLQSNSRKHEVRPKEYRIAFKIPDVTPYLFQFKKMYPDVYIVYMVRDASDTINSLLRKKWFSNNSLKEENRVYPLYEYKGQSIPHWVDFDKKDEWLEMTELDRCAYYYIRNQQIMSLSNMLYINYDHFIENPIEIFDTISNYLGLVQGEKTKSILDTIEKTDAVRDSKILYKISKELRMKVFEIENKLTKSIYISNE